MLKALLPDELNARLKEVYVDPDLDYEASPNNVMKVYDGLSGDIMKDVPIQVEFDEVVKRGADECLLSREDAHMVLDWERMRESPVFKQSLNRNRRGRRLDGSANGTANGPADGCTNGAANAAELSGA
ncbi:hypothetical protein LTR04_003801 [Oleoguttula sp. CCFEE 6159]|nr:hypothetical protein LTR04_003801 [Oleoguttula sp. CCFEE 6159]